MKPTTLSFGRTILFVEVLLVAACQSSGSGGGGSGGRTGGNSGPGTTGGAGGMTTTAGVTGTAGVGGTGSGGLGIAGNTGTAGTGTGGSAAGGAGAGGRVTDGGPSDAAGSGGASGATGGAGTSGRATGGGSSISGGTTGPGGAGAGGQLGGAGGTGSGGQLGGGGSGAGGSTTLTCTAPAPTGGTYAVDASGVTFTVGSGKLRVQVCKEDIIHVQYTSTSTIPAKTSLSVSNTWATPPSFCVTEASGTVTITTARMKAKVNTSTGIVSYTDLSDAVIVAESSKSTTATTVESTSTFKIQTAFTSTSDEALFGIGQHQSNVMNRKGTSQQLLNSNMNINIPVLVSNKGYGLFWDNYSTSNFSSTATTTSYSSECGEMVDYYFFYGPTIDQVVAGYRTTTGAAPLFPKWAYGLFQSKDHYASQSEVLKVKDGYRNAKIPVDVIVQDWNYWDPYSWGSHIMDPSRYADPKALMDTLHTANIHGMISIWPEYQYLASPPTGVAGDQDNYKALDAIKALLPNNGSAYHFYDVFNADARTLVYQQIYDKLLGKYGWDAIWADNTEPQDYPSGAIPNMRGVTTALGKGAFTINAYPLQHAKALSEGWRKVGPNTKRVYVLTRSAFAGTQRYGASIWSGDIDSAFATYAKQIPAGLNIALAGMPYWTTDIGGYFGTPTEESFTRRFQFGAFFSTFRIHGQATKELYSWSTTGKANLLTIDNLHYRLMPYLYSLAWKVTNEGYTIMRHLVFDYPKDANVFDIKDQFMYGPAILVNPVTTAGATSRSVYLPTGTWYDFWTGSTKDGGAKVTVDAPLSQIPLFVRAGSIVPMGPKIQYATESIDPLEIRIYKGQDGSFTLYEDEGDTYDYETGKYSQITFGWSESTQQLTIGARAGSYTGMPKTRTFNIVWVGANHGNGVEPTATPDKVVPYDGSAVVVAVQ